jgi:hypothetical protein
MKTLVELEPLLLKMGSTAKNGANWIERLEQLRYSMPPTLPGQSRMFQHIHAVELVAIAALVNGGAEPRQAAPIAAAVVRSVKATGKPAREWIIFACGNFTKGKHVDKPDLEALTKELGMVPLSCVPIGAVVRMVDDLYGVVR